MMHFWLRAASAATCLSWGCGPARSLLLPSERRADAPSQQSGASVATNETTQGPDETPAPQPAIPTPPSPTTLPPLMPCDPPGVCPQATGAVGVWEQTLTWDSLEVMSGEGLVVDPARPSDAYFFYETGTPNGNGDRSVMKSTDYGLTWTPISETPSRGNAWGVAIDPNTRRDPATPPTLYTPAGYGDLGIWKSSDGGVTWRNLIPRDGVVAKRGGGTLTFPPGKSGVRNDFYQVHILPDDPPHHILITTHYGEGGICALGESFDGGDSWEVHNVPFGDSHYVFGFDAQTWVLIAGWGGPGIFRTATGGRISQRLHAPSRRVHALVRPARRGAVFSRQRKLSDSRDQKIQRPRTDMAKHLRSGPRKRRDGDR
jgi:hypothetical protein